MKDEILHRWRHSHAFGQDRKRPGEFRTFVVIALTASMMVVEIAAGLAFGMLLANGVRLVGWHTPGIWKNAMLWSLYLSMWFICLGFLLFSLSSFTGISKYLAIHAFAIGGIGLVTMGMMARVSLGHTGRNVTKPPTTIKISLLLILLGALVRVLFPLIDVSLYTQWVVVSQILWIAAFTLFTVAVAPILLKRRIDEVAT